MGAPDLLRHLRGLGLVLTLTPTGALHVAPRQALTDDHRAAIRAERDGLIGALRAEGSTPSVGPEGGAPPLTLGQAHECHLGGWDDIEIATFNEREARFARLGRSADADTLAERLTLRDRQMDERRLCLECAALADNRRCNVAARGSLSGADRQLEPVPAILHRCPGFTLSQGLK